MSSKFYHIDPVAKPRMTRRDRWCKRPCVLKYREFKDQVSKHGIELGGMVRVVFHVQMPKGWSNKKKRLMNDQPHRNRPDIDNFLKALFDATCKEDSHIWAVAAEKRWSYSGAIELRMK
ncbi:RusA family crossover junction endodeoxyribonuclease [bacterium]|nr:RusA family crossover junction endodeoxyribonuclease [bacterium]